MEQQYLSTDPSAGTPVSMHIGPRPDDAPVTLADIQDDPKGSMMRIGSILKKDVSDPRFWVGIAASYFGPKVLGAALPTLSKASSSAMKVGKAAASVVEPGDVGIISPRIGKAVDLIQRARKAVAPNQVATSPVESVAGGTPPPVDPPVSSAPVESPAVPRPATTSGHPTRSIGMMSETAIQSDLGIAARRAGVKLTEPQYQQAEALVRQGQSIEDAVLGVGASPLKAKLSAAEQTVYEAMRKSGLSDEQAAKFLKANRALSAKLPSDAEVQAAVRHRNETGRWK